MNTFKKYPGRNVPGIEDFHTILRRERLLADRMGLDFSLVLFSMAVKKNGPSLEAFMDGILSRMRSSDTIGWFAARKLGVILAGTSGEGAVKFAHQVVGTGDDAGICSGFRVLRYPEIPADNERSNGYALSDQELQTVFVRRMPAWKRVIDIVGSLAALVLLAPVMSVTALYIKTVSPGPVFFRQKRVGYKGKLFTFLKFRTMHVNNDVSAHREHLRDLINSDIPMQKLDQIRDPRIIPGGNILRRLSIDEFPQFINVLKGDMSLIGPRPCIPYEAEEYLRWHTHRFDSYPGLSGLWQISGKNRLSFKEMIRLDITYANRMSVLQDLWIIVMTIPTLVGIALEKTPGARRPGMDTVKRGLTRELSVHPPAEPAP